MTPRFFYYNNVFRVKPAGRELAELILGHAAAATFTVLLGNRPQLCRFSIPESGLPLLSSAENPASPGDLFCWLSECLGSALF